MAEEYTRESLVKLTEAVKGKCIESFTVDNSDMDDVLIVQFSDGSSLRIRYDWIYEWEVVASAVPSQA